MEKLLTVLQVAELTSLARSSVYALVAQKAIPHIKLGSRVVFSPNAIQTWIGERSQPVVPQ